MSCNRQTPLLIRSGVDFARVFSWGQSTRVYKPITAVSQAAPVVLTVPGHGMPDGWWFWVESVKGMLEINRPRIDENGNECKPYRGTVTGTDTIEINSVNSLEFTPYLSGGTIVYALPYDLDGFTGECVVQASESDPTILSSSVIQVAIDNTAKTITLSIPVADVNALEFDSGYYKLDVISAGGIRSRVAEGSVRVQP